MDPDTALAIAKALVWLRSNVQLGTVSSFLTWITAVAALIVARGTFRQQNRQLKMLQDEQRKRDELERSEQARLIAVWFIRNPNFNQSPFPYRVFFSNASPLPVSNIIVTVASTTRDLAHSAAITYLPPLGSGNFSEPKIDELLSDYIELVDLDAFGPKPNTLHVAFTDMNQQRWSRNLGGELVPLHPAQDTQFNQAPDAGDAQDVPGTRTSDA